jgi:hypothetical protein
MTARTEKTTEVGLCIRVFEVAGLSYRDIPFYPGDAKNVADTILGVFPDGARIYEMDGLMFRQRCPTGEYVIAVHHPQWPRLPEDSSFPEPSGRLVFGRSPTGITARLVDDGKAV